MRIALATRIKNAVPATRWATDRWLLALSHALARAYARASMARSGALSLAGEPVDAASSFCIASVPSDDRSPGVSSRKALPAAPPPRNDQSFLGLIAGLARLISWSGTLS